MLPLSKNSNRIIINNNNNSDKMGMGMGMGDGDGVGWKLRRKEREAKNHLLFSICACHPCAGAMLIFSVSFQF